ncbi:hypothetical protein HN681_02680 [archaeon]|jgi:hypothetical protein|nr:hypothetical protein [archaeon]MBT3731177.1 hypothetical protein [archaeon]MBT4670069.1 hypothetical protein [archaeon]MBT5030631.1 hypothetical protein [archaeon]MBT5287983.1 hypothetical protein [archaeon]
MLKEYLSQEKLVQSVLTVEELESLARNRDSLNLMMGLTFDKGQPLDMLKYSLFIMSLSDIIAKEGATVNSNWLIADHFIVDINKDASALEARKQVDKRIGFLQKLNEVYAGNIGFVLSSKLSKRDEYQNNLDRLLEEAKINPEFKRLVLNAVPKERRDNPNALIYPFAELATIQTMDTDIKVGPPYEVFYDGPAREFSPIVGFKKYVAIHLTRGFPFGNPDIPEGVSEEIEAFGILPYKITSKGLADYRIDPINDSLEKVASLIEETTDQRSLVDLLVILNQAKQRLGIKSENVYPTDLRELKDQATSSYTEYVHKPLRG